jgi:hypothetical protein
VNIGCLTGYLKFFFIFFDILKYVSFSSGCIFNYMRKCISGKASSISSFLYANIKKSMEITNVPVRNGPQEIKVM